MKKVTKTAPKTAAKAPTKSVAKRLVIQAATTKAMPKVPASRTSKRSPSLSV